jgi:hypothetical protein
MRKYQHPPFSQCKVVALLEITVQYVVSKDCRRSDYASTLRFVHPSLRWQGRQQEFGKLILRQEASFVSQVEPQESLEIPWGSGKKFAVEVDEPTK